MGIVNTSFKFIGFNKIYIVYNFCHTHFKCGHAIVPTLRYLKCSRIWGFILVHRFIIEYYFITEYSVVAYYYYVLTDIIFINLRLI